MKIINIDKIRKKLIKQHQHSMVFMDLVEQVDIFMHSFMLVIAMLMSGIVVFAIGSFVNSVGVMLSGLTFIVTGCTLNFALYIIVDNYIKSMEVKL